MSLSTVRLADVTTRIGSGITPRGGSTVYKTAGRPFVRSQNIGWGKLRLDDMAYIDELTHMTFPATEIRSGDVLLNITGASIGRSAVATDELEGGNVNQHVCEIRLKRDLMDPRYVNAFLLSRSGQDQIDMFQAGGNRQGLNFQQVGSIRVPDLAIKQQRVIGSISDNADKLIATLERLIAKKQSIKQGMMQQLLTGRTRLPGFTDPWMETRLETLGRCIRGVGYNPDADLSPGDRPFTARLLRSNNVQNGRIERSGLQYVHERRVSAAQVLKSGDVVICMANGSRALVGKAALFEESAVRPRYTFGAFMGAFRTDRSMAVPKFVSEMMHTHAFRNWLDIILSGSSINNLRPGDVEGFAARVPDLAEQQAIADMLNNADTEIDVLRERLAKAQAIKTGMMQQLLTGRTRLPVEAAS